MKDLNVDARVVLSIMSYNIRPRAHVTTIPMDAALLMRVLMSRHSVDIATIMAQELRRAALSDTEHGINDKCVLPFPGLIMGLCHAEGVDCSDKGHILIRSTIDDVYIDRFCKTPFEREQQAAATKSQAGPSAGPPPPFDPLVAHHYYASMWEASQRSHVFLHDAMQQQYINTICAPEERTFPTRESYFTYCRWPKSDPFPRGGGAMSG